MARPYLRNLIRAILLATLATLATLAPAACGGTKDEPTPNQAPPTIVKIADLEPVPPRGARYAKAKFLVQISMTVGERGKGNSTTALQTHLSVVDDKLFLTKTPHGQGGERSNRAITLSVDERAKISQIVSDNRLTVIETIRLAKQPTTPHSYASASIKLRVKGQDHSFAVAGVTRLDGAATAFSQTSAFRSVLKVVKDISMLVDQHRAD